MTNDSFPSAALAGKIAGFDGPASALAHLPVTRACDCTNEKTTRAVAGLLSAAADITQTLVLSGLLQSQVV
jgi:hypothetical protein